MTRQDKFDISRLKVLLLLTVGFWVIAVGSGIGAYAALLSGSDRASAQPTSVRDLQSPHLSFPCGRLGV